MKEKRKGKFIPFASFLRPTEDLLWQSPESVASLKSLMPKMSLSTLISTVLFLLVIGGIAIMASGITERAETLVTAVITMIGLVLIWLRYTMRLATGREVIALTIPDQPLYAVTSERLFYQYGDDLRAEALANISQVTLLSNNVLSFGPIFPEWSNLENAAHVKSIIEQAQNDLQATVAQQSRLQDRPGEDEAHGQHSIQEIQIDLQNKGS